jgi:hypothetical protein
MRHTVSAGIGLVVGWLSVNYLAPQPARQLSPPQLMHESLPQKVHREVKEPSAKWTLYRSTLRDAFNWVSTSAPFFECSNADVTLVYHYRWRVFWMHMRSTPQGWVLTEFLRPVPWSGPHGTINCAFGHHAADGRWVREPGLMDNYSAFWWRHPRADLRYTWWPAHAALERFGIDGRVHVLRMLYPQLRAEYWRWVERTRTSYGVGGNECLWQAAHDDGEENSIGLDGCRPTMNAAWYGEARALADIAAMVGDDVAAATDVGLFRQEAARWQSALHRLWNRELDSFATRTLPPPAGRAQDIKKRRTKVGCQYCTGRSSRRGETSACPPNWQRGELVSVRELAALSWPWYHRGALPEHAVAWRQLTDPAGLAAKWGVRTAERRHRCYNFSTWCVTSWHGPVWPFESSKLATALVTALHDPAHRAALQDLAAIGPADFFRLLATYAKMHAHGAAREVPSGTPFVGESFHPDSGFWLTRELMFQRGQSDKRRGDHYLHSSYADLVLGGLVGLHVVRADADADLPGSARRHPGAKAYPRPPSTMLVVEPLFGADQLAWFAALSVRVRGRDVSVAYDRDGSKYDGLVGIAVWLDGSLSGRASTLQRLVVPL